MKRRLAGYLLAIALSLSVPAKAEAFDDMFSLMFRMMLTMMNVMSDMAEDDDDPWGRGWGNNWGGWPMMSGLYSPFGLGGLSPWSGFGGMPGMSPWGGWNNWGSPWGNNPWSQAPAGPWGGGYAPPAGWGHGGPASYGVPPDLALLDGRWFGTSGEVLEVRGNRFRLQHGRYSINGVADVRNNVVNLVSPSTGTATSYTFVRNQSELVLREPGGQVLLFTRYPAYRLPVHIF